MNRAGDQFFPSPGFTQQQDGGIARGHCLYQLQDLLECRAVANDLLEIHLAANFFFEIQLFLGEFVFQLRDLFVRQRVLDGDGDLTRSLAEKLDIFSCERVLGRACQHHDVRARGRGSRAV